LETNLEPQKAKRQVDGTVRDVKVYPQAAWDGYLNQIIIDHFETKAKAIAAPKAKKPKAKPNPKKKQSSF